MGDQEAEGNHIYNNEIVYVWFLFVYFCWKFKNTNCCYKTWCS